MIDKTDYLAARRALRKILAVGKVITQEEWVGLDTLNRRMGTILNGSDYQDHQTICAFRLTIPQDMVP